jgi:hypothetical protein
LTTPPRFAQDQQLSSLRSCFGEAENQRAQLRDNTEASE